ncbi:hypothetical protein [Nonomuraea typhae]|uniref:hypothetical protein n=1 Tax=Nonomuraea typhae TaxID=2603600 RepID=UPI0012FC78C7|nr:hypothetical protein [Nonomuraea typhae]
MRPSRTDAVVDELIQAFSRVDAEALTDLLTWSAAAVTGVGYAGFVQVDPLRELARSVALHAPRGDPLRVRAWLAESGVLKELAAYARPVVLPRDHAVGEPGFLAVPVPLATREHAFLWAAGRDFDDTDAHLLGRFATAAGRALEAASGMEAAVRLLRGVQTFRTPAGA